MGICRTLVTTGKASVTTRFPREPAIRRRASQRGARYNVVQRRLPPGPEEALAMVAVNYLWNPLNDNIVREFDDGGAAVAQYTTEPDEFGNVVSQRRDAEDGYFHYDGVGSTIAVTNQAGTVTDTREYTAFGEVTEFIGDVENPFQYVGVSGYYRCAGDTVCAVRRRSLLCAYGRWITRDPIGIDDHVNAYAYVANNPAVLSDPSGLRFIRCRSDLLKCEKAAKRRREQCFTRAIVVTAILCALRFPTDIKSLCACIAAIVPTYSAFCNTDYTRGLACCSMSFVYCSIMGRWPPWWMRFGRDCPGT